MPGYNETMLQNLQRLNAMEMGRRRLLEAQRQHEYQQRLGDQRLQMQDRSAAARMEGENFRNRLGLETFRNTMRHQLETERQAREEARRREEADKQRALDQLRGKLKPGYRWKGPDSAEQEMITGGPEYNKMRAAHAEDLTATMTAQQQAQQVIKNIDFLLGIDPKTGKEPKTLPEGFQSNFGGYNAALLTQHFPSPPGRLGTQDWKVRIEALQDQLKGLGAAALRKSGASPGSITEREWPIMAGQVAKLSPYLSESEAADILRELKNRSIGLRQGAVREYNQKYAETPFYQKNIHRLPSEAPQGVDPRVWEKMPLEKRMLWAEE